MRDHRAKSPRPSIVTGGTLFLRSWAIASHPLLVHHHLHHHLHHVHALLHRLHLGVRIRWRAHAAHLRIHVHAGSGLRCFGRRGRLRILRVCRAGAEQQHGRKSDCQRFIHRNLRGVRCSQRPRGRVTRQEIIDERFHCTRSTRVTVYWPPTSSTANLTLSPALSCSSIAASLALNIIVIGGMPRFVMGPCFSEILPVSRSTLRTSPSVSAAPGAAA